MTLSFGLYNKVLQYKNDNDFPSIRATIRYILTEFFKNKTT